MPSSYFNPQNNIHQEGSTSETKFDSQFYPDKVLNKEQYISVDSYNKDVKKGFQLDTGIKENNNFESKLDTKDKLLKNTLKRDLCCTYTNTQAPIDCQQDAGINENNNFELKLDDKDMVPENTLASCICFRFTNRPALPSEKTIKNPKGVSSLQNQGFIGKKPNKKKICRREISYLINENKYLKQVYYTTIEKLRNTLIDFGIKPLYNIYGFDINGIQKFFTESKLISPILWNVLTDIMNIDLMLLLQQVLVSDFDR